MIAGDSRAAARASGAGVCGRRAAAFRLPANEPTAPARNVPKRLRFTFITSPLLIAAGESHSDVLDRSVRSIEKPRTEVGGAAAVDDGRAEDVGTLLKREAPGHAIVNHRLPVGVDADHFLAVDPPYGRRIGSNREADVRHLARTVHDGDGPEEYV